MRRFDDPEIYSAILDSLHAGVYLVDRDGKIVFWNQGAERITGYLRHEVIGHASIEDLLSHTDAENNSLTGATAPVATAMRDGKVTEAVLSIRHKGGHRISVHLRTSAIRNSQGKIAGAAECFEERGAGADWDRRQDKLAAYGCLDDDSGVLNHGMTLAHIREQLGVYAEQPVPFSLICITIDELEIVRTRHGPQATHAILRVVAQTLENSLRPTDSLGRWKENVFIAVFPECGIDEVARVGERLRKMVSGSRIDWWGDPLTVTISLGATSAMKGDSVEKLVQRGERALAASVEQGGNKTTVGRE